VGTIGSRFEAATTTVQYARANAKHLLKLWIEHLALCLTAPPGKERVSVLVSRTDKPGLPRLSRLCHVEDAGLYLGKLVELYWTGQREPLLLFPKTSRAFCAAMLENSAEPDRAFDAARKVWTDRQQGERDDPSLRRLFGNSDVLARGFSLFDRPMKAGDFPELAIEVFVPLLRHLREEP
jgi:exodeoxyribonuclease V gamma subunit